MLFFVSKALNSTTFAHGLNIWVHCPHSSASQEDSVENAWSFPSEAEQGMPLCRADRALPSVLFCCHLQGQARLQLRARSFPRHPAEPARGTDQPGPEAPATCSDSHTICFWSANIKRTRYFLMLFLRDQDTATTTKNLSLKAFSFTCTVSEHKNLLCVPYHTATVKASCGAKNNRQLGCTEPISRTLCLWKLKSTMLPRKGWTILFTLIMLSAPRPTIKFGIRW